MPAAITTTGRAGGYAEMGEEEVLDRIESELEALIEDLKKLAEGEH